MQEIYKIFEEVAKSNKQFAKEFYEYRGIDYIPYNQDSVLQQQVKSIARLTADTYRNISNTNVIGLIQDGQFKKLEKAYYYIIDKAILSVSQGKEDFYTSMRNVLKEMGRNGVVQYESGRTRRLDSATRMNMLDGIRQLNNETSLRFGKEYDADGVEISVHSNPAPDHADIQGRQFSNEQYEILENGGIAKDYKGNIYDGSDKRHISQFNCYHKIFSIVLGVSEPEYTDAELKKIQEDNIKGFEFEGKHYTNYEGTQLQRRIETEIRRQKDTQILAKASGDMELVGETQRKITQLGHKYNDLCKASGLKPKKQRMSVAGYKRINVKNIKTNDINKTLQNLQDKKMKINNNVFDLEEKELMEKNLLQLDKLSDKYKHNKNTNNELSIKAERLKSAIADASYWDNYIRFNTKYFNDKTKLIRVEEDLKKVGWHYSVDNKDLDIYTITHEYGHIIENEYIRGTVLKRGKLPKFVTQNERRAIDSELRDYLVQKAIKKMDKKITITEFKKTYWSGYSKDRRNFEWFAEAFAGVELGDKSNVWLETFKEWLDENARK